MPIPRHLPYEAQHLVDKLKDHNIIDTEHRLEHLKSIYYRRFLPRPFKKFPKLPKNLNMKIQDGEFIVSVITEIETFKGC